MDVEAQRRRIMAMMRDILSGKVRTLCGGRTSWRGGVFDVLRVPVDEFEICQESEVEGRNPGALPRNSIFANS